MVRGWVVLVKESSSRLSPTTFAPKMATPVDPAVLAQLTELFPETPQDILMAVVEHCGSLESCTEALLQMNSSDPIPPTSDQVRSPLRPQLS